MVELNLVVAASHTVMKVNILIPIQYPLPSWLEFPVKNMEFVNHDLCKNMHSPVSTKSYST